MSQLSLSFPFVPISFLSSGWNSAMSVNTATDDSTLFRARGQSSQSTMACLSSALCGQTNSFADAGRAEPVAPSVVHPAAAHHHHHARSLAPQPMPIASESARKFGHTRLW